MEIDGFIDKIDFKKQIDEWIRVFRKTKPAPALTAAPPATRSAQPKPSGTKKQSRCSKEPQP
jgi:hypothetical protein